MSTETISKNGQLRNIKHCKYWLANKSTVSDDLVNLLEEHRVLTNEEANQMRVTKSTEGDAVAAFEVFRKVEQSTDINLLQNILTRFNSENQVIVAEPLKRYVKVLEDKSTRNTRKKVGLPNSLLNILTANRGGSTSTVQASQATLPPKRVTNSNIFYYFQQNHTFGFGAKPILCKGHVEFQKRQIPAAVKIIDKNDTNLMTRELEVWGRIKEEDSTQTINIVSLLEWKEEGQKIYIATKWADKNFYKEITENLNPFRDHDRQKIIGYLKNVGEALQWLHEQNILHRHVKPQNVLIYSYKKETVAKLGEFGISRIISNSQGSISAGRGTQEWMSPEQLEANEKELTFLNTKMVDIFAFGMLSYFGLTGGEHPFQDRNDSVHVNIRSDSIKSKKIGRLALATQENLLQWMMQKNPQERPTIKQILCHPFFWTDRQCLNFIKAVAAGFSLKGKDSPWDNIREEIDSAFKKYYKIMYTLEFDWFEMTDKRFRKRKSSKSHGKKYDRTSFISLVELVRDKDEHKEDMLDELSKQFIDNGNTFSKEKYWKYFHEKFPDMLIILFCSLASIVPNWQCLETLREEYLGDFIDCHVYWKDKKVATFLEIFTLQKMQME